MKGSGTFVALLRAINVGGHNKVPMVELRSLAARLGWQDVRSYVQSGNLVFGHTGRPGALEGELERGLHEQFGLSVQVIVRSARAWRGLITTNPFPQESATEPNLVMLSLSKAPLRSDAAAALTARATSGERIVQVPGALWIHFASGVAGTKLTPAVLERLAGSPVTMRNWRTVVAIGKLLA